MTIKAAILGASRIAPRAFITPAKARRDIEIIAVGCRDIRRGHDYITAHDLPANAMSYEEAATHPDIDIVYNALPPAIHLTTILPALKAGKAVLCEKPFSMNAAQARRIGDAAIQNRALILEAFHYQFHDAFIDFKRRIDRGDIGEVFAFEGKFNVVITETPGELRFNRALGGGALMDLGCYPLHAARKLFGEPTDITARAEIYKTIDRNLWARMRCGDVDVTLECSMDEVYRGDPHVMIMAHGHKGALALKNFVSPQNGHRLIHLTSKSAARFEHKETPSSYRAQLDFFISAWRDLTLPAKAYPQDFVNQMKAIDTIYAACGMGINP